MPLNNSRLKLKKQQGSDFDKLRSVREKFRTNYPLSGDLWIQWTQGFINALYLLYGYWKRKEIDY